MLGVSLKMSLKIYATGLFKTPPCTHENSPKAITIRLITSVLVKRELQAHSTPQIINRRKAPKGIALAHHECE